MGVKATITALILDATAAGRSMLTAANASAQKTLLSLVKGDVGLGNVDNTSDVNKPISTATATALTAKADLVGGVIPSAQIPPIAISEYLGSVASQAAMLALVGDRGDWCVRSDLGTNFVLSDDDSSLIGSWVQLSYPTAPVTSVAGRTGTITLSNTDISGLGTLATQSGTFSGTSSGTNTGDQSLFSTIAVSGQSNIVADATSDTLTLVAGTNITITTDAGTDTITIDASGGGGSVATDTIWDAAGDLAVGTGADTAVRLAKGTALQVLRVNAGATALEWASPAGGGDALVANPLSQFASTTSAELAGVISDETGSGLLVFATDPTFNSTLRMSGAGSTNAIKFTSLGSTGTGNIKGDAGLRFESSGTTYFSFSGTDYVSIVSGSIAALTKIGLGSATVGSTDVDLERDAADSLGLRRGTNGQAFRTYRTSTSSNTNYERLVLDATGTTLCLAMEKGGTGLSRDIAVKIAGTTIVTFANADSSATFTGPVIAPAATTSIPSIRLPHGTAPSSPTNGDVWTTTSGVLSRVNGVTYKIGGETRQISFVIGDGTNVITTGRKAGIQIPFDCVITGWSIFEDTATSSSIVVDIWKDSYANFPPVVGDTIAASAKPTLSAATKAENNTLTGWTTAVTAGDFIAPNVDSVTSAKRVVVVLRVRLT